MNHDWSATKQRIHPQSVAETTRHSVLSGDRIRQCGTSYCSNALKHPPDGVNFVLPPFPFSFRDRMPVELEVPVEAADGRRPRTAELISQILIRDDVDDRRHNVRPVCSNPVQQRLKPTCHHSTSISTMPPTTLQCNHRESTTRIKQISSRLPRHTVTKFQ